MRPSVSLETTARQRPVVRIGIVVPVRIELRPVVHVEVRNVVAVIAGTCGCADFSSDAPKIECYRASRRLYILSPEFNLAVALRHPLQEIGKEFLTSFPRARRNRNRGDSGRVATRCRISATRNRNLAYSSLLSV